jgi:hypothetical protein
LGKSSGDWLACVASRREAAWLRRFAKSSLRDLVAALRLSRLRLSRPAELVSGLFFD